MELPETLNLTSFFFQIFVPVNVSKVHWILVVMDFDKSEVQILDSMKSNTYVGAAYQVVCYSFTK
jgi:Ulp1 family protease